MTALSVSGDSWTWESGPGGWTGIHPSPSFTALSRCGLTRVPPLATVAIITASERGVTVTWPCPIATEIVSPGYHGSPRASRFQAADGTSPCTS